MKNLLTNKYLLAAVGGTAMMGVGLLAMKKASKKCDEIMMEHKVTQNKIQECLENFDDYTEEDVISDTNINNVQTVGKLIRNYSIPVSLTVTGGCIVLTAAYKMYNAEPVEQILSN